MLFKIPIASGLAKAEITIYSGQTILKTLHNNKHFRTLWAQDHWKGYPTMHLFFIQNSAKRICLYSPLLRSIFFLLTASSTRPSHQGICWWALSTHSSTGMPDKSKIKVLSGLFFSEVCEETSSTVNGHLKLWQASVFFTFSFLKFFSSVAPSGLHSLGFLLAPLKCLHPLYFHSCCQIVLRTIKHQQCRRVSFSNSLVN